MLRISGAIQVLEEMQALEVSQAQSAAANATPDQGQDADELAEAM
jgi:hypothetical protein